jgi:hypothetical protein
MLILFCLSLNGQSTTRYLAIKDSAGNILSRSTVILYDNNDKEICSFRSDSVGLIRINQDFNYLTAWLMGYSKMRVASKDFAFDTTYIYLESIRYTMPMLIIKKDYSFIVDFTDYKSYIDDCLIIQNADEVIDSVKQNDGLIIYTVIKGDTFNDCIENPFAIPLHGFENYYSHIPDAASYSNLRNDTIKIDFTVDYKGSMLIESCSGSRANNKNICNSIHWFWKPAKMWGKEITTKYRMMIIIE